MNKFPFGKISVRAIPAITGLVALTMASSGVAMTKNDSGKTVSSDGSLADTQDAVNYAVGKNQDGWVVSIGVPGATYTWASMLSIVSSRPLTVQGASPSARPTIKVTATTGFGVAIGCTDGNTVTLKDLRFNGWTTGNGLILIDGGGDDCFRLTNLEFTGANSACVWVSSTGSSNTKPGPYGLIDHCSIPNGGGLMFVRDNPAAKPNSWHRPMSWGTKHAVYVEDCTLSAPKPLLGVWGVSDGDNGSRFVVRHCTLTNMPFGTHGADSQPLENGQNPNHSNLQVEIMHNTFVVTEALDTFFILRGGSATVFDNTISGPGFLNTLIKAPFYRSVPGNGVCPVDRFYPADYPGTQQPGTGVVASAGQDPKAPTEPWGSVPIYTWGNKLQAQVIWGEVGGTDWVAPDRDYFVGKVRPGYTEYTYPHPLQTGTQSDRPAPPANVQVSPSK